MQRIHISPTPQVTRIDDAGIEGEPCAVVFTESKDFLMVVFPTAERLKDIRELAKDEGRTVVIVNPQWNDAGIAVGEAPFLISNVPAFAATACRAMPAATSDS